MARRRRAMIVGLAVLAAPGCGGGGSGTLATGPPPPAASAELEALYRARRDSALTRFTTADAEFMAAMIGHHAQALEMASLAPLNGASPEVRRLAARVTAGQEAEIALMRRWLEDRDLPAPAPHTGAAGTGTGTGTAAAGHSEASPGMLTQEEMRELEASRDGHFDRLFLTYMIQHHSGAVTMVERLFATPGAAQDASVFRVASGIQVDQRTEIARMQSMLDALFEPRRLP